MDSIVDTTPSGEHPPNELIDRQNALLTPQLRAILLTKAPTPSSWDVDSEEIKEYLPEDVSDNYEYRINQRIRDRLKHTLYDFMLLWMYPGLYRHVLEGLDSDDLAERNPLADGVVSNLITLFYGMNHPEEFQEYLLEAVDVSVHMSPWDDIHVEKISVDIQTTSLDEALDRHNDGEPIAIKSAILLYDEDEISFDECVSHIETAYHENDGDIGQHSIEILEELDRI